MVISRSASKAGPAWVPGPTPGGAEVWGRGGEREWGLKLVGQITNVSFQGGPGPGGAGEGEWRGEGKAKGKV